MIINESKTDENLNTGGRGMIEVAGKTKKLKNIIIIVATTAIITVMVAVILRLAGGNSTTQKGMQKKDEAMEKSQLADTSIAAKMNEILMQEEQRKKAQELQKKREQTQDSESDESSAPAENDAVSNIVNNNNDPAAADNTQQEKKPLTKKQRILAGDTLIETGARQHNTEVPPEKDYLQGGIYTDGKASPVVKRDYLLAAGTTLSCVLKTRIVTDYPGITLCQLTKNVWSDNGKTILVRAGAQLMGEQKQVIRQGIARVFVNWTTIKDDNVSIRIDALGTDGLGAAGLPAWIDSHFWDRFGGAVLLSFINDSLDAAKNAVSRQQNDNKISFDNSGNAVSQMAAIALENSINIPPTAYVNQGTILSVVVPRNIDFSEVYELEQKE